jgi:tetratricopeptide (TPR) repeat protein
MPDLAQLVVLLLLGAVVALLVGAPLLRARGVDAAVDAGRDPELEPLQIRHRVALEALRDLEADRRAGSLDDGGYARLRAEAEQRAAETLAALEAAEIARGSVGVRSEPVVAPPARRTLALVGAALLGLVLIGFFLPAPVGLANPLVDRRQQAIDAAVAQLKQDPRDTQALSNLADALLAGNSYDEMQRAAAALIALIALEPQNTSAYNRLITTYIRVQDWKDAADATDSLAKVSPDSADVPFFRGLIALRGDGDLAEARRQFARFEELAPQDPRLTMVQALLEQSGASGSPAPSPSVSPAP